MILELPIPQKKTTDPSVLGVVLGELAGLPCLKAEVSYGGELMLHFGSGQSYQHPKLKNQERGEWILGTRGSSWAVFVPGNPNLVAFQGLRLTPYPWPWGMLPHAIIDYDRAAEDRSGALGGLAGAVVLGAAASCCFGRNPKKKTVERTVGMNISFVSGAWFSLMPFPEVDIDKDPLADWELFTPLHTYLQCGPGFFWSYLRSDTPDESQVG